MSIFQTIITPKNWTKNEVRYSYSKGVIIAAGIWFLGVNSLDLLLDNFIGNVDFKKINII